jgi:hypothetical protein
MDYPPARLLNPRNLPGLLAASLVVALLGAAPASPRLELQIARATYDPLDALDITVRVKNGARGPVVVTFPQTAEYGLALASGSRDVWTSPATTGGAAHHRPFPAGETTLVTYEWNGVLADGTSPAPGVYVLRGTLLTAGAQSGDRATLRITAPLPISALAKTGALVVTVSGTLDATGSTLHDATGDVKLARRIAGVAPGTIVDVRGSMQTQVGGRKAFEFERWAPTTVTLTAAADSSAEMPGIPRP